MINIKEILEFVPKKKHSKCLGRYDEWQGEFTCDYETTIRCEDCKYGFGRKDPEAKCNQ